MTPANDPKDQTLSLVSNKEEQILEAVRLLGYATAQDITRYLFSEGSLNHVRAILAKLSGGEDFAQDHFLLRIPVPVTTRGTKERAYTLGAKARELFSMTDYYRPYKYRYLSYSHLMHHLVLARLVCSAQLWCLNQTEPQLCLIETRLCHDLARELGKRGNHGQGKSAAVTVVPDAFLNFDVLQAGRHGHYLPLLVELDRGSEYRKQFQQHIRERIEFIQSGAYTRCFGVEAVRIAYATTGGRPAFRHSRLSAMLAWTDEVLTELKLEAWAPVFYFTTLIYEDIYTLTHFAEPVWYTPGDPTPKLLLE
jgi:hypothetical protein